MGETGNGDSTLDLFTSNTHTTTEREFSMPRLNPLRKGNQHLTQIEREEILARHRAQRDVGYQQLDEIVEAVSTPERAITRFQVMRVIKHHKRSGSALSIRQKKIARHPRTVKIQRRKTKRKIHGRREVLSRSTAG